MSFLSQLKYVISPTLYFFLFFFEGLIVLCFIAKVYSFCFCLFFYSLFFISFLSFFLISFALLLYSKVVSKSFVLDFLECIQVSNYNTKYLACLGFHINYFLYYLFETSWHSVLLFYFNFDRGFKVFPEIVDYSWLIKSPNSIKLC